MLLYTLYSGYLKVDLDKIALRAEAGYFDVTSKFITYTDMWKTIASRHAGIVQYSKSGKRKKGRHD